MWGKLHALSRYCCSVRITPTCVGKATLCVITSRSLRGSPPHVWGKPLAVVRWMINVRITPTCVGKAIRSSSPARMPEDHPHMCGESNVNLLIVTERVGSPPHVWGKPRGRGSTPMSKRITPTCVGKALTDLS